jgi:GH25 family lysozyme M1 (1,4-beta-N-acetylmuramidase)
MSKKFVDVSSYNGSIKWSIAKAKGVEGAIIKIIRKDLSKDNKFVNNYKGCNENGIPWGVYNYSYADNVSKAKSDMKLVCDILDKIDKKYFRYGVWFDIEDSVQAKLSKTKIAEIINAAQEVVESRGYQFGVYTGKSYYAEHIDATKVKCKNWWIARYYLGYDDIKIATNPNASYKPSDPADIFAWQYTSSGVIASGVSTGNSGHFDLNLVYKDMGKLENSSAETVKKTYSGKFPMLPDRGYFKLKDESNEVRKLQKFLNWYDETNKLAVDGIFGEKTRYAVIRFQKSEGLNVDGLFGSKSLDRAKKCKK